MTHLSYARAMVSQHPEQPASHDPYDGMTDEQVLARAAAALGNVNAARMGSVERALQWAVYESAKAELDVRLYSHILRGLSRRDGELRRSST